jgi:acyl-CoA synthetase (NDP forming)
VDTTADILRDENLVGECLRIVCQDNGVGTVLFPIPMDYGPITGVMARAIQRAAETSDAVIVPVWMSRRLGEGFLVLDEAGLMPFFSLSDAIGALRKILPQRERAAASPHCDGQPAPACTTHSEIEGKARLAAAGIQVPSGQLARSIDEACAMAAAIGYPVVLKVVSAQIAHKTEVGGVKVGIAQEAELRQAHAAILASVAAHRPDAVVDGILVEKMFAGGHEVLIGVHRDAAFGPVLTFGLGGVFVEVLKGVLPITPADAHAMVREIRAFPLLAGVRGQPPADLAALEALLLQVSDFVGASLEPVLELDLNPVWVGRQGQGAFALDALLVTA